MPKVTVIIPVYNQEILIKKAIESVPLDCELIVVNDCSTDSTLSVIEGIKRDITIISNKTNRGVGYTINRGLDVATGDYIVLLGSDDYFYTEEFCKVVDQLSGDLVYFNLQVNDGYVIEVTKENREEYCGSVKFMRREFIGSTRNPVKRVAEDLDFNRMLLDKNPTEKFTGIIAKHYNYPREGSLSHLERVRNERKK